MKNKEQKFKQVYKHSKDKVYRLCLGFMGNKTDADDLFQEVLIKVWNNLDTFRNESNIDTWIYRITTNTALLTLNRKTKLKKKEIEYQPNIPHYEIEILNSTDKEQKVKKLYKAISLLKEIDRIIIGLLLENCSYDDISNITGLKTSNVGVRINRIKKILSKKLK
ncbi:RNA polymerase sigma factor [Lacinutrix sp. C3R15]|uniref:RNA polymerase sigma factor n=1 Tax=Flavobacteriaceae TaxID=49546 RepID=UPI001C093984|nr:MULTISPECIES: RNA polymerase sigma factor [Flavobacteriaceae]MBU2940810.1 RNA polymerase sigma factor [Lacinutrix sp. C3R15]MDO6624128.1 RNA polymerase sigma factor [Oceanihabitans sp. 1_MG-2023]